MTGRQIAKKDGKSLMHFGSPNAAAWSPDSRTDLAYRGSNLHDKFGWNKFARAICKQTRPLRTPDYTLTDYISLLWAVVFFLITKGKGNGRCASVDADNRCAFTEFKRVTFRCTRQQQHSNFAVERYRAAVKAILIPDCTKEKVRGALCSGSWRDIIKTQSEKCLKVRWFPVESNLLSGQIISLPTSTLTTGTGLRS
jgi:hypothetical protein